MDPTTPNVLPGCGMKYVGRTCERLAAQAAADRFDLTGGGMESQI